MNYPKLQTGDIYVTDNWKTGAKIVQFLSTCNTCWEHLFLFLFNKDKLNSKRPAGYHYGMVLHSNEVIEQQGIVEINDINKIFKKEVYIYRKISLTYMNKLNLINISTNDLGKGYGILECIGKFFSWITGIKQFAKWFDSKGAICVCRVGEWFVAIGQDIGESHPNYLKANWKEKFLDKSNEWKLIYKKEK